MSQTPVLDGPDALLLGFARALREAGLPVTADRAQTYLAAVATLGAAGQRSLYVAGRATLCAGPEDFDRYDQVFAAWFLEMPQSEGASSPATQRSAPQAALGLGADGLDPGESAADQVAASDEEVLRHRDIASVGAAERSRLNALFARLAPAAPRRTSFRRVPSRRGSVDADQTLRRTLHRMGEPVEIAWRRRTTRPRRIVLLVDVSGSMSRYADALLRLAHRVTSVGHTEVFSMGTRVTRLTQAMRTRDPDRALVAAGAVVPDWSGGTRLGEGLKFFLDRWGQRGLVRGAVVVVFSDGWERGEPDVLREQMARLHRLAHRVVWVNPHKGAAGYQPVQQGMVAALPFVDDFVAGHSVAAFEKVLEVVADA